MKFVQNLIVYNPVTRGVYPPQDHWRNFPPNLIGHRSFMELDLSPWGNCKRRRREAAIAEGKKLLATRGSRERRKLPRGVWGRSPRNRKDFEQFMPKIVHFWIF